MLEAPLPPPGNAFRSKTRSRTKNGGYDGYGFFGWGKYGMENWLAASFRFEMEIVQNVGRLSGQDIEWKQKCWQKFEQQLTATPFNLPSFFHNGTKEEREATAEVTKIAQQLRKS